MDWSYCFNNYTRKYRAHVIERMYQRDISFEDIEQAKSNIELIEEYPDDFPFPSCLVLGFTDSKKPLHLVFAVDQEEEEEVIVITIYIPNSDKWENNYKTRR